MEMKKIKILKDSGDKAETKFVSLNGVAYNLPVNEVIEVPSDLVEEVLLKGNLKDRVAVL